MCGRYGFIPGKKFAEEFEIDNPGDLKWDASYNLPPASVNPIVTMNSPKHLTLALWGLIPHWAKDKKIAYATINARSEDIETKPTFREAFKKSRCLVPCSFYFEFARLREDPKIKIPYLFKVKDQDHFSLAGLYSVWVDPENGREIPTYTIITTEANSLGARIHHRMPCILHKNNWDDWADNNHSDSVVLKSLLKPFPSSEMESWPVSREINNPRNDRPDLIMKTKEFGEESIENS